MKLLSRKERARHEMEVEHAISIFQSDTQEIEHQPDPPFARATLWLLALFIVSFIVWATVSQLDRVVTTRGSLQTTTPSIIVQPLETSIVKDLKANVGDVVKAGQVLALLDPTFVQADVDQVRNRQRALSAQIARLEAEMDGHSFEPADAASNPEVALQLAIWGERQAQYMAQLRSYDEKINASLSLIKSREGEQQALNERLKVLSDIESMRNKLLASETGSRLNLLMATDSRIEVGRNLSIARHAVEQERFQLEGLRSERDAFVRDWRNRAMAELVTARNEISTTNEQLVKARRRGELVSMQSPVDAIVLERAGLSIGSVLKEAEPFFTLVPLNAELEVEMQIDASDIGFVRTGDPVHIKLDAYDFIEHGMLEGEVTMISEDAFQQKDQQVTASSVPAYYKARAKITQNNLRNIPANFRLLPGLPLTAEIKVGHRAVISYLVNPIVRGLGESMREP